MTTLSTLEYTNLLNRFYKHIHISEVSTVPPLIKNTKRFGFQGYAADPEVNRIMDVAFNENFNDPKFDAIITGKACKKRILEDFSHLQKYFNYPLDNEARLKLKDINDMLSIIYHTRYTPKLKDTILFRGMNPEYSWVKQNNTDKYVLGIDALGVGDTIYDPFILSTSLNRGIAFRFACSSNRISTPTLLIIRLQRGTGYCALDVSPCGINDEKEVLLPPLTSLHVKLVKNCKLSDVFDEDPVLKKDCRINPSKTPEQIVVRFVVCDVLSNVKEYKVETPSTQGILSCFRSGGSLDNVGNSGQCQIAPPSTINESDSNLDANLKLLSIIEQIPSVLDNAQTGGVSYVVYHGRRYKIRIDKNDKRKRYIETKHGRISTSQVRKEKSTKKQSSQTTYNK